MKQEAVVGTSTPSKQIKALYRKRAVKDISLKAYAQDILDVNGIGLASLWFKNKAGAMNTKPKSKKVVEKVEDKKVLTRKR